MSQESTASGQVGSYLESAWTKLAAWVKGLNLSTMKIAELFAYAGIGFFIGFLLKKHFRILVAVVCLLIVFLWVMAQFDIVIFNWRQLQQLANVRPTDTVSMIFNNYLNLVKAHWVPFLGGAMGMLFGYRIG